MDGGQIQLGLFDERNLLELSHPKGGPQTQGSKALDDNKAKLDGTISDYGAVDSNRASARFWVELDEPATIFATPAAHRSANPLLPELASLRQWGFRVAGVIFEDGDRCWAAAVVGSKSVTYSVPFLPSRLWPHMASEQVTPSKWLDDRP